MAATTLIGSTGTNGLLGSAYINGNLYGFGYISKTSELAMIYTSTGAATATGVSLSGPLGEGLWRNGRPIVDRCRFRAQHGMAIDSRYSCASFSPKA